MTRIQPITTRVLAACTAAALLVVAASTGAAGRTDTPPAKKDETVRVSLPPWMWGIPIPHRADTSKEGGSAQAASAASASPSSRSTATSSRTRVSVPSWMRPENTAAARVSFPDIGGTAAARRQTRTEGGGLYGGLSVGPPRPDDQRNPPDDQRNPPDDQRDPPDDDGDNQGNGDSSGGGDDPGPGDDGSGGDDPVVDLPVLVPGHGFTGPTPQPPAVGDPGQPGYDARAIARWDVVPFQTFDGDFHIGVVAFHVNGIDRVEFSVEGGPWEPVYEMKLNPRTRVREYTATLRPSDFDRDGPIEVRAIAYPSVGVPRVLQGDVLDNASSGDHALPLFVPPADAPGESSVYVAGSGDDANPGTRPAPVRTIRQALSVVPDGGRIVLLEPGRYLLGEGRRRNWDNQRWVTIAADDGLDRDEVFVLEDPDDRFGRRMIPRVARIKFEGVTLDFREIGQIYGHRALWFDDCVWTFTDWASSNYLTPTRDTPEGSYVTDSEARDAAYGFTAQTLVRNAVVHHVGGDVFQNSAMVLGSTVRDLDRLTDHHLDLYQMWGPKRNVIIYGIDASNVRQTQAIFLEPTYRSGDGEPRHTLADAAFVDINVRTTDDPSRPPYSQMISRFEHVYFRNVRMPGQRLIPRADVQEPHNQAWHAHNVVFESCEFYGGVQSAAGVTIR